MPNFKKNKGYKKDFKFAKNPYPTSKPVWTKKWGIRSASEILGNQPGYNPNTGKIIQGGSVNIPSGGMGSAKFLGLMGRMMAGVATGAAVVAGIARDRYAKKRWNESQAKWKKKTAEYEAYLKNLPK
jgi:hypothetical protein